LEQQAMNKAFIREPDDDGRDYCPRCRSLGIAVEAEAVETHVRPEVVGRLRDAAWFCSYPHCEVAYFNPLEAVVTVDELLAPVYPKDPDAPICACFGFTYDDAAADAESETPVRIRALLAKSKSPEARCRSAAADGRCCIPAVQELYMKLRTKR
jgi:Zinc binding domain